MANNKTEFIGFRTSKEVKEMLEEVAKKNDRSMSNMLEVLIKEAYEKETF